MVYHVDIPIIPKIHILGIASLILISKKVLEIKRKILIINFITFNEKNIYFIKKYVYIENLFRFFGSGGSIINFV